jgi:hypothetical protein
MKKLLLLIPLYAGFLTYMCLNLVWGQTGLVTLGKLDSYRSALSQNLEDLERIYGGLFNEVKALSGNQEVIRLHARELGYFYKNEKVLKFQGMAPKKSFYRVGSVLELNLQNDDPRPAFLLAAALVAALLAAALFLFNRSSHAHLPH